MAFIAINAKADVENSKKGKLTPAQNAQVNAWTLSKKTGIFRTLGECTASVSTPVQNEAIATFNKGYFAVCGRIVEVEQGTTVTIPLPANGSVDGNIVARFDLSASHEEEFQVLATTEALVRQDLNADISGRYDFVLYGYTATSTGVVLKNRGESIYIEDVAGNLENFEKNLYGVGKPLYGYINSKGTIEQRLTNLGFKQGGASFTSGTGSVALKRQGNYVIAEFNLIDVYGFQGTGYIGTPVITNLPQYFRPVTGKTYKIGGLGRAHYFQGNSRYVSYDLPVYFELTITTGGTVSIRLVKTVSSNGFATLQNQGLTTFRVDIGFEAPPIQS